MCYFCYITSPQSFDDWTVVSHSCGEISWRATKQTRHKPTKQENKQASSQAAKQQGSKQPSNQGRKVAKTGSAAQARRPAEQQVSARLRAPVGVERAPSCHRHARSDIPTELLKSMCNIFPANPKYEME